MFPCSLQYFHFDGIVSGKFRKLKRMCSTLEDIEIKLNYIKALLSSNKSEKKDKDELP